MKTKKFSSLIEVYKISMQIAGERSGDLRASFIYSSLSSIAFGLSLAGFYPLFYALLSPASDEAWRWLALMGIMGALSLWLKWKSQDFDYSGEVVEVTHELRHHLGKKLRHIPLESLYRHQSGDLNAVFASDVDGSVLHLGIISAVFLEVILLPLTTILATFVIDWRLGGIMAGILLLSLPLYHWKRKLAFEEKSEAIKANARLESELIEYIQGLPVLRSINQTGQNRARLQESIAHVCAIQREGMIKGLLPMVLMLALTGAVMLSVLAFGSLWVEDQSLALASVAATILITSRLTEPLSLILAVASLLDYAIASFGRIQALLNIPEMEYRAPLQKPTHFDIAFENVSFAYTGGEMALKGINLAIPERSLVAIVGASGSGKSTLAKMLLRYGDPQNGSVKIGGIDLRAISQEELMSRFSVVFQDVYLFDDTILENIRLGKKGASDEEVRLAAKRAFCHEFIERLPQGYLTKVGDIGNSLSGGERQRLSIARAMLKDSPIVILDEPTAALDTESEVAVQRAIDSLIENKTVIVIAHRLSTIIGADQILVMEEGGIVESGTHAELIARQGRYHGLWEAQKRLKVWNLL